MAIKMEWNIPKDGVVWAAKYTSSGVRRFSTLGLGLGLAIHPITCRHAPARPAELAAAGGHPAIASCSASTSAVLVGSQARHSRVCSAPSSHRSTSLCETTPQRHQVTSAASVTHSASSQSTGTGSVQSHHQQLLNRAHSTPSWTKACLSRPCQGRQGGESVHRHQAELTGSPSSHDKTTTASNNGWCPLHGAHSARRSGAPRGTGTGASKGAAPPARQSAWDRLTSQHITPGRIPPAAEEEEEEEEEEEREEEGEGKEKGGMRGEAEGEGAGTTTTTTTTGRSWGEMIQRPPNELSRSSSSSSSSAFSNDRQGSVIVSPGDIDVAGSSGRRSDRKEKEEQGEREGDGEEDGERAGTPSEAEATTTPMSPMSEEQPSSHPSPATTAVHSSAPSGPASSWTPSAGPTYAFIAGEPGPAAPGAASSRPTATTEAGAGLDRRLPALTRNDATKKDDVIRSDRRCHPPPLHQQHHHHHRDSRDLARTAASGGGSDRGRDQRGGGGGGGGGGVRSVCTEHTARAVVARQQVTGGSRSRQLSPCKEHSTEEPEVESGSGSGSRSASPHKHGLCSASPPVFANEHWYQKGCKLLAKQRSSAVAGGGTRRQSLANSDDSDYKNDPDFIVQQLARPTASSRNRQVAQLPASSPGSLENHLNSRGSRQATDAKLREQQKQKQLERCQRFHGQQRVTAEELRQIVGRLSACDPLSVPESGRSSLRGKGLSDRRKGQAGLVASPPRSRTKADDGKADGTGQGGGQTCPRSVSDLLGRDKSTE